MTELPDWAGARLPEPVVLDGRRVRLEPLAPRHATDLFALGVERPDLYDYLVEEPPASESDVLAWIRRTAAGTDQVAWAVVDRPTGRTVGRQSLLRIVPHDGVIEIGGILWGPAIARTPAATEAFRLLAGYVFDGLGYRRLEWKCNDLHERSKAAALRLGFTAEGRFAQHMVVKGRSRDTAWFALLDGEWPAVRARLDTWLDPSNFDDDGRQRRPLERRHR